MGVNYLEFIPVHNKNIRYETNDNNEITIFQENKGFFHWIAQKCFKRPRFSQIHLDPMGNFIWPLMDGQRNLLEIADCVKEHFGAEAEPLYDRLVQYIKTLESYGFIVLDKSKAQ